MFKRCLQWFTVVKTIFLNVFWIVTTESIFLDDTCNVIFFGWMLLIFLFLFSLLFSIFKAIATALIDFNWNKNQNYNFSTS
jgi:hypothetical protein